MSDSTNVLTDENSFYCGSCGRRIAYVEAITEWAEHAERHRMAIGLPRGTILAGTTISFPRYRNLESPTKVGG